MTKKKIIIIGSAYPYRGGLASFNERMAQGLQQMGHEVEIVTFTLQYPDFLFPGKTQFAENEPAPAGLHIERKISSVNPFNWLSVGWTLRQHRPDLVICKFWLPFMGPAFGTILRLIRSNGHIKVVSVIDNIIPHEKRIGDAAFAKYFVNAVDAFIVMSKSVGEDMKQFTTGQPVEFIPHPVYDNYGQSVSQEAALKRLKLPSGYRYALFFGFIRDYKGLDLLLEAMADSRIRKSRIRLIVAGEFYGNRDYYEELIRAYDIKDQLELRTDFIPNEEVKYYFSAAEIVVQPYKSATQSGISQLAYHFEKPMIVTNVGGLPEIVPHGKVGYVTEVNATAIADAMVEFFEKYPVQQFATHLKANKKLYSWDNLLGKILELAQK